MLGKDELEASKKLFLLIHDHRNNFLYKTSIKSKDWLGSGWKSSTEGFNQKTQKGFISKLTDIAILDVIAGKNTSIHAGYRRIDNVEYLGCRFGKYTQYFAVDIDNKSNKYNSYYSLEIIDRICEITKHIGTPIFMQSSYSKGWHLRWYFTEPIKTWDLAVYLENLFQSNGFILKAGKCEIFPNRKATPTTLYNGIRLPCQKGSALLSLEDGRVLATHDEDPVLFLYYWAEGVNKNFIAPKILVEYLDKSFKNENLRKWHEEYQELKEKGFTGHSQTNYILGQMAKHLRVFEHYNNIEEHTLALCKWLDDKHNGFSEEYNHSKQVAYDHCRRWAKAAWEEYKPYKSFFQSSKGSNEVKSKSAKYKHIIMKGFQEKKFNPETSIRKISSDTGIPRTCVHRILNTLKIQRAS